MKKWENDKMNLRLAYDSLTGRLRETYDRINSPADEIFCKDNTNPLLVYRLTCFFLKI